MVVSFNSRFQRVAAAAQSWCVCPVLGSADIMASPWIVRALPRLCEGHADSAAQSEPLKHDTVEVGLLGMSLLSAEESVALFNNL